MTDQQIALLTQTLTEGLTRLGIIKTKESITLAINPPIETTENLSAVEKSILQVRILHLLNTHFSSLMTCDAFLELIKIFSKKSAEFTCPAVLRLILYCNKPEKAEQIYQEILHATAIVEAYLPSAKKEDIHSTLGYLVALNFNRYSCYEMLWSGMKNQFSLAKKVKRFASLYVQFYQANEMAMSDPKRSRQRRWFLESADLLPSPLQRDFGEVQLYETRMLSASEDKARLLNDMKNDMDIAIVDVGPGGGAILRQAASAAAMRKRKNTTVYYGIEYDPHELLNLYCLLDEITENTFTLKSYFDSVVFLQGNAIELYRILRSSSEFNHTQHSFLLIVLCSVIHEIYSYCRTPALPLSQNDVRLMTPARNGQYNLESIFSVYRDVFRLLCTHEAGGSINIRDGVMYQYPDEQVAFTLNSIEWVQLFQEFLNDEKYTHLKNDMPEIKPYTPLKCPAKFVQEFMLKANWGARSFGNEINEVYCYLTLKDHQSIIEQAAEDLGLKIQISICEEYIQEGYKTNITEKDITILEGFGPEKFPPTNMHIKIDSVTPMLAEATEHNASRLSTNLFSNKSSKLRPKITQN